MSKKNSGHTSREYSLYFGSIRGRIDLLELAIAAQDEEISIGELSMRFIGDNNHYTRAFICQHFSKMRKAKIKIPYRAYKKQPVDYSLIKKAINF